MTAEEIRAVLAKCGYDKWERNLRIEEDIKNMKNSIGFGDCLMFGLLMVIMAYYILTL